MASFLDLFTATDPAGASAARYRLHFLGSQYVHQDSWIFGMATELVFTAYQMIVIPANAMLGLVLSSGSWLTPLSETYQRFTAPFYAVFPPWRIACLGLGIVVVATLRSRPKSTSGELFTSEALNRLGAALAMVVLVGMLAHNPFAIINQVLELANGFSTDLAAKVTGSGNDTTMATGQALVDQSIREPAIALNYGHGFSDSCKQQWSLAMASGQELPVNSGCYVKGQNKAGPDTVLTSVVMLLLPAIPHWLFSAIAAWKYVVHLSMSVLTAVMAAWAAAFKVHRRRGFDKVSEVLARAGAHLLMAVITSMVGVALPAVCSGLALQILSAVTNADAQVFLMMLTLGVGFAVSTWVILKVTSNQGPLVRVLKADAAMTMESTLGMKPVKLNLDKFGIFKFNPFGNHGADGEFAVVGKEPRLSADPLKSISGSSSQPAQTKETTVNTASVTEDAEAVKQLSATSAAVAGQRLAPASLTVAFEEVEAASVPPNRMWQASSVPVNVTEIGDVYGYFIKTSTSVSYGGDVIDVEVIGVTYDDQEHAPPAERKLAGPAAPDTGADPAQQAQIGAPEAVLADPERRSIEVGRDELMAPVSGNVYADPALDEVARAVGATFTSGGTAPTSFPIASLLRGFSEQDWAPPIEPTSPAVQHGPVLCFVDGVDVHAGGGADQVAGRADEPVNDQQRWNRGGWRSVDTAIPEPVTSSIAQPEAPASGIFPGTNRHPASFCAPMRDFVATEDLQVQMEEMELVCAAAGQTVSVALPEGDRRLSVRLSSDPDERVVRVSDVEFGDPL